MFDNLDSDMELTKEMAASLGIPYDPENPPKLSTIIASQIGGSMQGLASSRQENDKMMRDFQRRHFGGAGSNLTEEQRNKVDQITKVLNNYPDLIEITTKFMATVLLRKKTLEDLLNAHKDNPFEFVNVADKLIDELLAMTPDDMMPPGYSKHTETDTETGS